MKNKYKETFDVLEPSKESIEELKKNLTNLQKSNKKWIRKRDELQKDVKSVWKGFSVYILMVLVAFGIFVYTNIDNKPIHHLQTRDVIHKTLCTDDKDFSIFLKNANKYNANYDFVYEHRWKTLVTEDVFDDIVHRLGQYQLNAFLNKKTIKIVSYEEKEYDGWIEMKVKVKVGKDVTDMAFKSIEENGLVTLLEVLDEGNIKELTEKK